MRRVRKVLAAAALASTYLLAITQGQPAISTPHNPSPSSGGMIVLDRLLFRDQVIQMAAEITIGPPGASKTLVSPHEDCRGCHQVHNAQSGQYLLAGDRITSTCLTCHDGSDPVAPNIGADLQKISLHDTNSPLDPPNPIPGHATCADCHQPHTIIAGSASPPTIPPDFGQINGVSVTGAPVDPASSEYEVCFKCHADQSVFTTPLIPRMITQTNTRLEFDLSAISFHPVEGRGRNRNVPSLIGPTWNEESKIYCSDCHGSETSQKAGGSGPNGVHGSNDVPLLLDRYETAENTLESAEVYALCYRCHSRASILNDESFEEHKKHVKEERTPCSVCHDAHGISSFQGSSANNSHLINFDTTVVSPEPKSGLIQFVDGNEPFSGSCTLQCHDEKHDAKDYHQ